MPANRSRGNRPSLERLWRNRLPIHQWPLWAPLATAAAAYAVIIEVRKRWWRTMARDAGIPVISVGNLTVGGNGKTPFTLFLASLLSRHGLRVGIVSRGWGRMESNAEALVSDGTRILLAARAAGDEPLMMAKAYPGPIAVARRRLDGIRLLTRSFVLDTIVLDDGFQHLRLKRNLDLLLIDEARGFGNGWILPAGPLREPLCAIDRADAVVLINALTDHANAYRADSPCRLNPEQDGIISPAVRARLNSRPVLRATIRPHALVRATPQAWQETALALDGIRVAAVSGIADARGFHAMLKGLGAKVVRALDYPDHHDYSPTDWETILDAARGTEMLITTEKDLVKLEGFLSDGISLYALRLAVTMDAENETRLLAMVRASVPSSITDRSLA